MKKLTIIMLSLVALIATSCGSNYNEKTCEDLCEKINDGKKLTEDDYAECIKQCSAIMDEMSDKLEDIKAKAENKDDEAIDMWEDFDSEYEEMSEQFATMMTALENAELKGENKTDYKELKKQAEELAKLIIKTNKKVNRLDD
jgi:lipoprotein